MNNILENLGPLAPLVGIWEGDKGDDVAPADDRGIENNKYRERMVFEAIGPNTNHEQILYGLRYSTKAWRTGEENPFHEDMGYWLWDAKDQQLMKCFVIPRGITVIAGATVDKNARSFTVSAREGEKTYGLCHNRFLEKEFRIAAFHLSIHIHGSSSFTYDQQTLLWLKGRSDVFNHRDQNILKKVSF